MDFKRHSMVSAGLIIFFWTLSSCTASEEPLFKGLKSADTGVTFVNTVTETDEQNMLTFEYIYNGAGVAAADFDNDGQVDLYFLGNEVSNELYLNQGDFQFENVTQSSGTAGSLEKWYSGVAIVDINSDGLPDIYLSVTGSDDVNLRKNELYINLGKDDSGVLRFEEMAESYGLDHDSHTTQTVFFDYDNNGVLDAYLLVADSNSDTSYGNLSPQVEQDAVFNADKLLQGVWNDEVEHPMYSDVSQEAGIIKGGYGLSVNILDINGNGYKDIYVANDYVTEDLFWINNQDGTFSDMLPALFKHSSFSAMGSDVADINNNGFLDIFTLDMLPEINVRAKMMANPNNYRNYVNNAFSNFFPQVTKNTLQLNMGTLEQEELPVFSKVASFSGVEATDWSWAALFADFTNSGYKDLFVTNGIPRDITDKDFWQEYGRVRNIMPKSMALPKIPDVHLSNYIYENQGDLTFLNKTTDWGTIHQGIRQEQFM